MENICHGARIGGSSRDHSFAIVYDFPGLISWFLSSLITSGAILKCEGEISSTPERDREGDVQRKVGNRYQQIPTPYL
jgi:hypothetical protein